MAGPRPQDPRRRARELGERKVQGAGATGGDSRRRIECRRRSDRHTSQKRPGHPRVQEQIVGFEQATARKLVPRIPQGKSIRKTSKTSAINPRFPVRFDK